MKMQKTVRACSTEAKIKIFKWLFQEPKEPENIHISEAELGDLT